MDRLLEMACRKEVPGLAFTITRIAFVSMVSLVGDNLKLNPTKFCCLNYTYNSVCETCRLVGIHKARSWGDPTADIPKTFTQETLIYNYDDDDNNYILRWR